MSETQHAIDTLRSIAGNTAAMAALGHSDAAEAFRVAIELFEAQRDGLVVVLPCKTSAKIFEADRQTGKIFQRFASKEDMLTKIIPGWGKRYFATPAEAEAALAEEK